MGKYPRVVRRPIARGDVEAVFRKALGNREANPLLTADAGNQRHGPFSYLDYQLAHLDIMNGADACSHSVNESR